MGSGDILKVNSSMASFRETSEMTYQSPLETVGILWKMTLDDQSQLMLLKHVIKNLKDIDSPTHKEFVAEIVFKISHIILKVSELS